jgi:hypothetical protein
MKKTDEKLKQGMYQMGKKAIGKALSKCNIHDVMICRNCGSKNTYKCRITDVIVCKDCDYQD